MIIADRFDGSQPRPEVNYAGLSPELLAAAASQGDDPEAVAEIARRAGLPVPGR